MNTGKNRAHCYSIKDAQLGNGFVHDPLQPVFDTELWKAFPIALLAMWHTTNNTAASELNSVVRSTLQKSRTAASATKDTILAIYSQTIP